MRHREDMDNILAIIVRLLVWMSGFVRPLSRLGLCRYEAYTVGQPLKILLVGYNGARNTGADARVVALTQQLEQTLGADKAELTVMTLDMEMLRVILPEQYICCIFHQYSYSHCYVHVRDIMQLYSAKVPHSHQHLPMHYASSSARQQASCANRESHA